MTDQLFATIYAPLGPIATALLAAGIALIGLIISKENKVSEFRQAWIDALRGDISRYVAAISVRVHVESGRDLNEPWSAQAPRVQSSVNDIAASETAIRLRLNRVDSDHELRKLNNALLESIRKARVALDNRDFHIALGIARELHEEASPILKKEWDRVKTGERVYNVSKWVAIIVFFVSIVAFGYLVFRAVIAQPSAPARPYVSADLVRPMPAPASTPASNPKPMPTISSAPNR